MLPTLSMAVEDTASKIKLNPSSISLNLPYPKHDERQKYVINVTSDDGFICHNFYREKEIKDKLFELQTKVETIPELENKLLKKEDPVSFMENSTISSLLIGLSIGLVSGVLISKRK